MNNTTTINRTQQAAHQAIEMWETDEPQHKVLACLIEAAEALAE